jgi:hypothetical protein
MPRKKTDIVDRLCAACNGKPAQIKWPHRLLHDAIAEIENLRARLLDKEAVENDMCRFDPLRPRIGA